MKTDQPSSMPPKIASYPGKSVTINDVAARAKVSVMTVSRSVRSNHSNPINPATAERVRQIAQEMGYRPSQTARALIMRKTLNVGFCINHPGFSFYSSLFQPVCDALQEELTLHGYRLGYYFFKPGNDPQFQTFLNDQRVVDAIVVLGRNLSEDETDIITQSQVRAISLYREVPGLYSLVSDDYNAGCSAADYLWNRGFRHVTLLSRWVGAATRADWNGRILGFKKRAGDLGLAFKEIPQRWDPSYEQDYALKNSKVAPDLLDEILSLGEYGQCIYATFDACAIGLVRQVDARNLVLGTDISVLGFDNMEGQLGSAWSHPRLTTFDRPRAEIGRRAARIAMNLEGGDIPAVEMFNVPLLERESVGFGPFTGEH